MKKDFLARQNGRETRFFVELSQEGKPILTKDKTSFALDIKNFGEGRYTVLHEGKVYDIHLEKNKNEWTAFWQGRKIVFELFDERLLRRSGVVSQGEKGGVISSPMPGKVVKILAKEGKTVRVGEGLIVVEAMKMENEFKAPCDGVVKMIQVSEGEAVEGGQTLVVIDPSLPQSDK